MKTLLFALNLFIGLGLFAQASWINYANDHIIWDIATEGDYFWVATQGGLVKGNIATGEKEIFQSWNSGLRGSGIKQVEVSPDGTKWLGSENAGLFSWDGNNWENYYFINTGDTLIELINLKLSSAGNPWFLSNVNGSCTGCKKLISYDGNEFQNHQSNLGLGIVSGVTDFIFIDDTDLWVLVNQNIVRYDGNQILEQYTPTDMGLLEDESARRIAVDDAGDLWISTSRYNSEVQDSRILRYDGTDWIVENDNAPGHAYRMFKDENGTLWFNFNDSYTNYNSYAAFDGQNLEFWSGESIGVPFPVNPPSLHTVDANGNWWVETFNGMLEPKVYRVNGSEVTAYDTQITPVGSNNNDYMMADCDNNIWLVGNTLSKFDGQNWEVFTQEQTGFPYSPWQAAIDPQTCDIWFAIYSNWTEEVDVARYDGSNFTSYSAGTGGALAIDVAADGTVYVGTTNDGVAYLVDGNWSYFNEDNSPLSNHIWSVNVQSTGALWAGSYQQGIARWANEEWTVFDGSNSPVAENCFWMYEDSQGNVWVSASGGGLAKYNGIDWTHYPLENLTVGVSDMKEDHFGNFWLGSLLGAVYWDGFSTNTYNIHNSALGASSVSHILIDSITNDVWFEHHPGISVLSGFQANNSIGGLVFFDANQDGSQFDELEDVPLPNQQIRLLPDNTSAITNTLGEYKLYPPTNGTYEINYEPQLPFEPVSATSLEVMMENESINDQNFAAWTEDIPEHISIDIATGLLVCNETLNIWVTFRNEGFQTASGEIRLNFPQEFTYFSAYPATSSFNSTEVTWSFSDLDFMQSRTYRLALTAPGVDQLEEVYEFIASVESGDLNESATDEQILLCSYDPNDKAARPVGESIANYSLLGEPLQYTIRFQNMGNYRAKDVVITDIIDPSLDISTFQILSSSHPMTTTIAADREVTFRFLDINLPPEEVNYTASQGFVKYQIAPLAGLADATLIENTAAIYFDLNPAIITNTTENILVETLAVGTNEAIYKDEARLYPNPSHSGIWIDWQETGTSTSWEVEVFDLAGKLVTSHQGTGLREQINIPVPGLYLLSIRRGAYRQTEKVVVLGN